MELRHVEGEGRSFHRCSELLALSVSAPREYLAIAGSCTFDNQKNQHIKRGPRIEAPTTKPPYAQPHLQATIVLSAVGVDGRTVTAVAKSRLFAYVVGDIPFE